jgi:hypothetical protein
MFTKIRTITGDQLATRWGVGLFSLAYIILKHDVSVIIPPQKLLSKIFFNPNKYRLTSEKVLNIIKYNYNKLSDKLFLIEEIENLRLDAGFLRNCPKSRSEWIEPNSEPQETEARPSIPDIRYCRAPREDTTFLRDLVENHENNIKKHPNVFSLVGRYWFIKYQENAWGLYPDQKKYKYLAHLLCLTTNRDPNLLEPSDDPDFLEYTIDNVELCARVNRTETSPLDNHMEEDVLNLSTLTDNLTPEDFDKIKDIGYDLLEKLNKAKESNNLGRIAKSQNDFDKYLSYLLNEHSIKAGVLPNGCDLYFKRLYRSSAELEKIRQLIKNNINNAKKDLQEHMPTLKTHLDVCLNIKSRSTSYIPGFDTKWMVSI